MKPLDMNDVKEYVNKNIVDFHCAKINSLSKIDLKGILKKKNPYLFKAKNLNVASDLIRNLLDAFLSSSEEKLFGDFLESLAIYISGITCNGQKSSATGIDLEFTNKHIHYIVSIKSGPNWGNNAQQKRQEDDFKTAVKVLKQSKHVKHIEPVLGICYGRSKISWVRSAWKIMGQNFWYFISENESLYIDIIEPLGNEAKKHNDLFNKEKEILINRFTALFLNEFCNAGEINWKKLVEYNSGNIDLGNPLFS